ncbi:MAG: TRAP transporter small permease [Desulfobacteraceae bacterium]|nr:MAG: TRAP transporter small permease [Desulfobacteraceae bacterium]
MAFLDKLSKFLNQVIACIAGGFLVIMVLLTCANIFLRMVWIPIKGTFELMGFFGAIVTAFALGYTQIKKGHIAVDVLISTFPKTVQNVMGIVNSVICMIFFAFATWQISNYGTTLWKTGEMSETLRIIYYPFTYGVAFGCAALSLVFMVEMVKVLFPEKEAEN